MYDALLFFHFMGLAMAVGTSFTMMALGTAAKELEPATLRAGESSEMPAHAPEGVVRLPASQ